MLNSTSLYIKSYMTAYNHFLLELTYDTIKGMFTVLVSRVKQTNAWLFTTHMVDLNTGDKIHKIRHVFKTIEETEGAERVFRKEFLRVKVEEGYYRVVDENICLMLSEND